MPLAMPRTARTQTITPKMYRHFAVITVCITACMAVFADGENREAISAEITRQPQPAAARKVSPAKSAPHARRGGGWGGDGERIDGGDGVGGYIDDGGDSEPVAPQRRRPGPAGVGGVQANGQLQGYEAIKPGNPALRDIIRNEAPSVKRRKAPPPPPDDMEILRASAERSGSELTEF